jgi:beta-galactosidase
MNISMKMFPLSLVLAILTILQVKAQVVNFNKDWQFVKDIDTSTAAGLLSSPQPNNIQWSAVSLPHTARIEPVQKVVEQWQGTCYYRKFFVAPAADKGKVIAVRFDGAMHEADVFLNGKPVYKHLGGFLPFYIDLTKDIKIGRRNCLLVKLNNQDNPLIPPGKPIKDLDFNYYGGLYRNAWLIVKNKLHISDAVAAGRQAAGGVLLHDEAVSETTAKIIVSTDIDNDDNQEQTAQIKLALTDEKGNTVASSISNEQRVNAHQFGTFQQSLMVQMPRLWSPAAPYLYHLRVRLLNKGKTTDQMTLRTGIKTIKFTADGFYLNGKKLVIRGTNRHQEYPYIGYALSDNAQYRDAFKIKSAGFNFVRCSHYPPSTAYLDACDEMGLMVMDAIPGWQFFGGTAFQQNSFQNIRDMIRRDRNHASIVLWEASLNETGMSKPFMDTANRIAHRELPFAGVFTSGWLDYAYDVSNPARQHKKAPDYWKKYDKDKPLLLAEYGDWEYYAQNAGFNQTQYQNLTKEEKSSRQVRAYGQERLLQQALNFQEAHNDNLNGKIVGDVNWLMFDYKRGYATDLQTSGVMDIFRLPKFSYYFFQSQADARESKPMLYIASYWNDPKADTTVIIYSNCDEVALTLNGRPIARQKPDTGKDDRNLVHPPFAFHIEKVQPGALRATGYIAGKPAATSVVTTPGGPYKIVLKADESGRPFTAGCKDAIFVYAYVTDRNGVTIPGASNVVHFTVGGPASIVYSDTSRCEAGIAPILLMGGNKRGTVRLKASAGRLQPAELGLMLH